MNLEEEQGSRRLLCDPLPARNGGDSCKWERRSVVVHNILPGLSKAYPYCDALRQLEDNTASFKSSAVGCSATWAAICYRGTW